MKSNHVSNSPGGCANFWNCIGLKLEGNQVIPEVSAVLTIEFLELPESEKNKQTCNKHNFMQSKNDVIENQIP